MGKSKKRDRRTPRTDRRTAPTPPARWRVGYFFVHGVGNQRPGDALVWGESVTGVLRDVHGAHAVQWQDQPLSATREDREIRHAEVTLNFDDGRPRTALFAEALWSEKFVSLGRPSMRRTLVFLLAALPLLAWIIGPDRRDLQMLAPGPSTWRQALRDGLAGAGRTITSPFRSLTSPENRSVGRMAWRVLTLVLLAWLLPYSIALAVSGSTGSRVFLVFLLAALAWWARSRMNIIWHVRVAATDEARTQQLLDHLHQKLNWMERQCDEVIVIAHSQGGYLMHRVLAPSSPQQHGKVRRFIGVGSGLKPISLLKTFHRPEIRTPVWVATLCVPLLLWGIGPITWQALGPELSAFLHLNYTALHATVMPLSLFSDPEVMHSWLMGVIDSSLQLVKAVLASLHLDFAHMAAIAGGISLSVFAGRVANAALTSQPSDSFALDHVRRGIEWREYTSPHDMVGRMLGPEVPEGVDQPWISATGNPVADHTLYFHPSGVLPRRLAADLLQDLSVGEPNAMRPAADAWAGAVAAFDDARRQQAARRRMLHGLLFGLSAALLLAPALYQRASFLGALLSHSLHLVSVLLMLTLLFAWIAHRSAVASARAFTRRLIGGDTTDDKPWQVRIVPPGLRTAPTVAAGVGGLLSLFGCVWFTRVAIRYGDDSVWLGYPLLLPLAVGLPLLACATAAGYPVRKRWPVLLTLSATLALCSPPARRTPGLPWDLRTEVPLTLGIASCALVCLLGVLNARRRTTSGRIGPLG